MRAIVAIGGKTRLFEMPLGSTIVQDLENDAAV
jgi:hypothetical protein